MNKETISINEAVLAANLDADVGDNTEAVAVVTMTDADAEERLPGYAMAFEEYHLYRAEGDTPQVALEKTMVEWRELWAGAAYVPHQRR